MIKITNQELNLPSNSPQNAGIIARWFNYLQQPVDGASLAIFRVFFAVFMLVMIFEYWHNKWINLLSANIPFHFSYIPGLPAYPGDTIFIHFIVMALLAIQIGFGILYRPACFLFFLAETYVFLLEKSLYQNHLYLVCLLSLLLFVVSGNRVWAVDNIEAKLPPFVPRWNYLLLKTQFVIVYFFGGVAKLNPDWLQGEPQTTWLKHIASSDHTFGFIIGQPWFAWLVTYAGIGLDLSVGLLLAYRPTFLIGAILALAFHAMNARLFSIGIFPWLMIASIGLFAPEDWPRRVWARISRKQEDAVSPQIVAPAVALKPTSVRNRWNVALLVLLHLYILGQVLIPLRRFLYPGDASWTEQGHRFAWGMKLRDKKVVIFTMNVIDPKTGVKQKVDFSALVPFQLLQMKSHPDMILQYAHELAYQSEKKNGIRPIVKARAITMLNQHPGQDMINPEADLASEPMNLMPETWIVPLQPYDPNAAKTADAAKNRGAEEGAAKTPGVVANPGAAITPRVVADPGAAKTPGVVANSGAAKTPDAAETKPSNSKGSDTN